MIDVMATRELTPKGQAARERIVAAASAEMFNRGVGHTTLDQVKATAGVSSSQLYHYFDDKQALTIAVIEHQTNVILGGQGALDSLAALRAWRDALVGMQRDLDCRGGCPIGAIGSELAETDPEGRAAVALGFQRWEDAIRVGLRTMHERGELAADPDRLALALLTALQGGLAQSQIRRDTVALEAILDIMLDHIATLIR